MQSPKQSPQGPLTVFPPGGGFPAGLRPRRRRLPSVGAAPPAPWVCGAFTQLLSLGGAGGSLLPTAGRGACVRRVRCFRSCLPESRASPGVGARAGDEAPGVLLP